MGLVPDLVREFKGRESLVRLLTYVVRCHEVSSMARLKLKPQDFDAATQHEFQVAWIAAKAYWEQYNERPSMGYMTDVCVAVMQAQGDTPSVLYDRVKALVQEIYNFPEDQLDPRYGKELLQAFLSRLYLKAIGQLGATHTDAATVHELVESEFRDRHVSDMHEIDPFDIDEETSFGDPREPLGTAVVDKLMGGGTFSSDVIGILGPTGGGKTMLALQIAGGLALKNQHVLYFTYESPPEELRPRLFSCIGRIHRDKLEGKRVKDLDPETKETVKKAIGTCKKYVTLIDRASEGWSPIEVEERLRQAIAAGQKPRLIVIDWLWVAVSRASVNSAKSNRPDRMHLNDLLDSFKGIAAKYKVNVLVLQQLSTDASKKNPGRKPQWFNSAEAGSFAWLLSYCFAIGTADDNGYCWIVGSKARHSKKQDVMAQMLGEYNRFDLIDKALKYTKDRGFVPPEKVNSFDEEAPATDDKARSNYEQNTDFA